jgi:hypothetical protein
MSWADDRFLLPSLPSGNSVYGSSLLIRVGADGTPLDEFPIAIPFVPVGIVWSGSEWVVAGYQSIVRISAEGSILEVRPIGEPNFSAYGLAWTGNALVMVGKVFLGPSDYAGSGGLRALTLDAELHIVARAQLTVIVSDVIATAGDGQSAITLWRDGRDVSEGEVFRGASFGPDGLVRQIRQNLVQNALGHPYINNPGIGATGKGYVIAYADFNHKYKAGWIEPDLDTRAISLSPHELSGISRSLAWDGTALTLYSTDASRHLLATRFSDEGFLSSAPQEVGMLSADYPVLAAAGIAGKTVVTYAARPPGTAFKFRVLVPPAFPESPERSPVVPGPLPQDYSEVASTSSQSLVVWRERTSPAEWRIYATRLGGNATVLDPDSLSLATSSCDMSRPSVATDGENYLAAWHDQTGIGIAAVRADGTFTKRPSIGARYGATCMQTPLKLVSNGTDSLLLWVERPSGSGNVWSLVGMRLRMDGSSIDTLPIAVGTMTASHPLSLRFHAASDGQDYLIAWEGAAVRVSGEGALLDTSQKILLGKGSVLGLWWNGKTYVAHTSSNDGFRFLRIGSDGSGGRSPSGPQADPVPLPGAGTFSYDRPACDASGCWVGGTVRHAERQDTIAALRYVDDGTQFTIRRQDVENVSYSAVCDLVPSPATIVNAGRPAFLFLPQRMEQPYSSVHRLMIAPFAVPRGRAARHP